MYDNMNGYGDLWRYLAATEKKILLYGMGNGADKILSVAENSLFDTNSIIALFL